MTFAKKAILYFGRIKPPDRLPIGVHPLYPHKDPAVQVVISTFFNRYYSDEQPRILLIGINPGRMGAGITGVNFTAPRQLSQFLGIKHPWPDTSELSAEFIYDVILSYGGPAAFFGQFYLGSVSPIGFIRDGKNLNYYDDPLLQQRIRPYALKQLKAQIDFGIRRSVAICIGGDKNLKFLKGLNDEHNLFDELRVVPHPRFIQQYRRSAKESYIQQYLDELLYCIKK
ncbi:MAG: DUF4918 family protein [Flavipsychrobacter sp.]|nr:DUF4918 family protein [Flavipsychrobacter sp.]